MTRHTRLMSGELGDIAQGLGDVGAGIAIAHVAEPTAGEDAGHTHEGACLNCETPLVGPHCHACGQRAHLHRTLGAFFHDLLHGVLHFEGKTWRTIPLLAWQPGKLTREYIDGKRARYVSPIALFLFVVFLSFALFNALNGGEALRPTPGGLVQIGGLQSGVDAKIAKLEKRREQAVASERPAIDAELARLRSDRSKLGKLTGRVPISAKDADRDTINAMIRHVRENPQLAIYKAQTSAYKYSWMLIPLSVPFVWMLFPFSRRFLGYDHTVFVTYSISFMIALVALSSVLSFAGSGAIGLLVLLYAPFHMYRHLRGTYALSRFGALWRMLVLSLFAWFAISLFTVLILWMAGS